MPSESFQKYHTCSEPVRKVSAWDPFLVKVWMSFYSVNTFSKLFTFKDPAESSLLWLHRVGIETLWGSAGFQRNLLRFVSVIWTETTTWLQHCLRKDKYYKTTCASNILEQLFCMSCFYFLRTFPARGETANKHWILFLLQESALETLAMTVRHVFCCLPRLVGI